MRVGIVMRDLKEVYSLKKELVSFLNSKEIEVIGVLQYDEKLFSLLNGFVFQGGTDYTEEDLRIMQYAYDHDLPTLGICLGMQTMGIFKNGILKKVSNHQLMTENKGHMIHITRPSKLYDILGEDHIEVNSRHEEALGCTDMTVSAMSYDEQIEAIEDPNKRFFLGVQWHPESIPEDKNSQNLLNAFYFSMIDNLGNV